MSAVCIRTFFWLDRTVSYRLAALIIYLSLGMFVVAKFVAVLIFTEKNANIGSLGFEFGPYIATLIEHGRYAACMAPSCAKATRLPALPLFYFLLSFISKNQLMIALIKAALMSAIFVPSLLVLLKLGQSKSPHMTQAWSLIGPVLFLSPVVAKHSAAITYEEGILTEVLLLWGFSFLLLIKSLSAKGGREHSDGLMLGMMALAIVAYLTKSSMILFAFMSIAAALVSLVRYRDPSAAVAVVACVCAIAAWGVHNEIATGRFSLMSSDDGYNGVRGWDEQAAQVYPQFTLDRLYNSKVLYLRVW